MKNILIGKGLDKIPFGLDQDQLKAILGAPDEIEKSPTVIPDEPSSEVWHYDEAELSALFDYYDNTWELVSLATTSEDALLNGVKLIGLQKKEVIQAIQKLSLGKYTIEDLSTEENAHDSIMSFEATGIDFWFEANTLIEIQWSPIIEE